MTSPKSLRSAQTHVASLIAKRAIYMLLMVAAIAFGRSAYATTATSTALSISSTSVPYKTPITLTATVTANGSPVTSGLVLFCDAAATHCENNSSLLAMVQLTSSSATAVVKIGSGPQGIHKYKAVYRANNTYDTSTSNTVSYTVQGTYASDTALASSGSVGSYTLAATVTGIGSVQVGPSGTVSFLDVSVGNNVLGTQTLGPPVLSNAFTQAPNSPFAIGDGLTAIRTVAIASAYLDGDNNLDIITGDADQVITVLLGNGDGTFQSKVNYTGCQTGRTLKIQLGDFNRDGTTDIALGCSNGNNGGIAVLMGNGNGSFQTPVYYSTGDLAGLAMGDFNGDGILDLAATDKAQQDLKILLGNGNGSFQSPATALTMPRAAHDLVVADFNGDGNDDFAYAVATSGSGSTLSDLYVALGNGNGTFQTAQLQASDIGEFLTGGDTNGDNIVDIVSSTVTLSGPNPTPHIANSMFVLIGNGDGTFKPTVTYVSDIPSDPHLTDVNGDGKADIIAGGSYGALVYKGNGNGTFQAYSEPIIGGFSLTYAVNAGDYNNDGNADLIGTDANSPRAAVALSEVQQSADAAALTGVAVFPLGSGIHNVDASYSGDAVFLSSLSSTVPLRAAAVPTALTLSVSPSDGTLSGQSLTLTATLSPFNVTGPPSTTTDGKTINFYNGATLIGTGTLNSGVATFTTSSLPAGTDALKAVFSGTVDYGSSTSGIVSVTVSRALLASAPNPSDYGQSVALTATVSTGATGTITFKDGGTTIGTATVSSASASMSTSTLTAGSHSLTAVYSGDGSHTGGSSAVVTQVVNKITPIMSVSTAGQSTYLSPVTITATLPSDTTGTVTFTSGATTLGTASVTGGSASITTTALPVQNDNPITATYGGDTNYKTASASTTRTVSKASPSSKLTSSANPSASGVSVTFTDTLPTTVSGTVTFTSGSSAVIGTSPVVNGLATISTSSLPVGQTTITATYNGDDNNNTSVDSLVQTVKQTPSIAITSSANPSSVNQSVTFTATLPSAVTNTVTFTDGATTLGTVTVTSGVATVTTLSLTAGSHTITATYNGDGTYGPATTNLTQIVKGTPTITVATSGPSTFGNNVTITATVPSGVTGTVTFTSGSTSLGTANISGTTASVSTSTLPVGSNTITATYNGDTYNNTATAITTQVVSMASTTTTLASSLNPSINGQSVTFTATLSSSSATGSITFSDGASVLGTTTVSAGVATFSTSTLNVGAHTITAAYSGDTNWSASTSAPLTQNVNKVAPTVNLASSLNPSSSGQPVTFTATLSNSSATGNITFSDGATVLGATAVSAGVATFSTSTLNAGTHIITAAYSGDTTWGAATSGPLTQTVKGAPTVNLTSSLNPSSPGQSVTFTATLSSSSATGNITFSDGATILGTASVSGGSAAISTSALSAGSHTIIAAYGGDTTWDAATSGPLTQTVKVSPTVNLASSLNPSTYNQSVTFTATLSNSSATGNITFSDGATVLGTTAVSGGSAAISTSTLNVGSHIVTAAYSGDPTWGAATSLPLTQTVNKISPTLPPPAVSNPNIPSGTSETITETVPPGVSGPVTFYNGSDPIGTAPVVGGTATITVSNLPVGNNPITASTPGDANNNPATSPATTVTVTKSTPTVTLTSSKNPSAANESVIFTATVPTSATGTITFTDGATVLGTAPVTNGTAAVTANSLTAGTHTIVATYVGDSNYNQATSAPLTQIVDKATPSLPPPSVSNPTEQYGGTETITETVPPGVSGPVTFYNGSDPIGTAPIVNGTATITVPNLPVGSNPITATTPGDANNNPATSPVTVITVTKTTPVLPPPAVSNPNPAPGTSVTITETVPPGVTGPITFSNGSTPLGTVPVVNGVATITVPSLPIGSNPITASVAETATSNAATSPATNVTVATSAPTVTVASSLNPAQLGQAVTFTATLSATAPSGTITFRDGATVLGTANVSGGVAILTTSTLAIGTHTITATYGGDTAYSTATSAPLSQVIGKLPTSTVLSQTVGAQLTNSTVTFTATVSATVPTPTGTVTFLDGTTVLGTAALNTNGGAGGSQLTGTASITISTLAGGSHTITAVYSGDNSFLTSTSDPLNNAVHDFTITNTTTGVNSQGIFPGDSTSYKFTLTPTGTTTFINDVNLTIKGLPEGSTYTFSPSNVANGAGTTAITLNLKTSDKLQARNSGPQSPASHGSTIALGMLGLLGLGTARRYRRRMPKIVLALLLMAGSLLPVAALTGCAGGYFTLKPTTYTVTVTGTEGTIQHSATATLVVQ